MLTNSFSCPSFIRAISAWCLHISSIIHHALYLGMVVLGKDSLMLATLQGDPPIPWSGLLAVMGLAYASLRSEPESRSRRAWGVMAVALALNLSGDLLWPIDGFQLKDQTFLPIGPTNSIWHSIRSLPRAYFTCLRPGFRCARGSRYFWTWANAGLRRKPIASLWRTLFRDYCICYGRRHGKMY